MRFYLNVPLVVGYVLMATSACLGMLQLAAARGGYAGLSLFTADRQKGTRIGAGLAISALLAYVLFAPEILTPGPAGTEVAEMFAVCALAALVITLVGADQRLGRERRWETGKGEPIALGNLPATLHRPTLSSPDQRTPALVLLPDPTGFVVTPKALVETLQQAGIAVLALDARQVVKNDALLARQTLLGHLSTALVQLAEQPGIDMGRSGLLGLGLGGNAALRAAATDPQIKAAGAVLPVGELAPNPEVTVPGLYWLRESSYRQVWLWRRRWPTFQRAADALSTSELAPTSGTLSVPTVILHAGPTSLAMRMQPGVEYLTSSSQRHFTILEDTHSLGQLTAWFQEKLQTESPTSPDESRITNHE